MYVIVMKMFLFNVFFVIGYKFLDFYEISICYDCELNLVFIVIVKVMDKDLGDVGIVEY